MKFLGFSDGVRYSEERILRDSRPNPQKFPARFARQETEQSFEISPLKYEPKLDLLGTKASVDDDTWASDDS